ncbi:MFS transporter [Streptomyces sp. ZYX-F-203]
MSPGSTPVASERDGGKARRSVLVAAYCGLFAINANLMITYIAVFDIRGRLELGESGLQWFAGVYSLGMAATVMVAATLADTLGVRRVYTTSLLLFMACSVCAAFAPGTPVLLAVRGVQGAASAAVLVTSLALVGSVGGSPATAARAVGGWVAVGGTAVAVGPPLGGFLTETTGWRSAFLAAFPFAACAAAATWRGVVDSRLGGRVAFDWWGQVLFVLTVTALTLVLIQGRSFGWTSWPTLLLCSSTAAGLVGFLLREARAREPMLDVSLFRDRLNSLSVTVLFFAAFCNEGVYFVAVQYYRNIRELSPLLIGLFVVPFAVGYTVVALRVGWVTARAGLRSTLLLGQVAMVLGLLLMIFGFPLGGGAVPAGMALVGVASALLITPVVSVTLRNAPRGRSGMVSGIVNTQQPLGGALSFAALGTVLTGWLGLTLGEDFDEDLRAGEEEGHDANAHPATNGVSAIVRYFDVPVADLAEREFVRASQISMSVAALVAVLVLGVLLALFPRDADRRVRAGS